METLVKKKYTYTSNNCPKMFEGEVLIIENEVNET